MSYGTLLNRQVVIEHPAIEAEDSWGHVGPFPYTDGVTVSARIQDRRGQEITGVGGLGGTPVYDAVIYLAQGAIVTEQDRLRDAVTGDEFDVLAVIDEGGQGHHTKALCLLVKPALVLESGS